MATINPTQPERAAAITLAPSEVRPVRTVRHDSAELTLALEGTQLVASLNCGGDYFRIGSISGAAALIQDLEAVWRSGHRNLPPADLASGARHADEWLRAFGTRLFEGLVPADLHDALRNLRQADLNLQLGSDLAGIPWELAFDGRIIWGHAHTVSRTLLGQARRIPRHAPQSVHGFPARIMVFHEGNADSPWYRHAEGVQDEAKTAGLDFLGLFPLSHATSLSGSPLRPQIVYWVGRETADPHRSNVLASYLKSQPQVELLVVDWVGSPESGDVWRQEGKVLFSLLDLVDTVVCLKHPGRWSMARQTLPASVMLADLWAGKPMAALSGSSGNVDGAGGSSLPLVCVYGLGRKEVPANMSGTLDRLHRLVTGLSYDIEKSSELMTRLGQEEYSVNLAEFHRRCTGVVLKWGGQIRPPEGNDGTMCLFGALESHEETVRMALGAAQEVLLEAGKQGISVRIGVATGLAAINPDHVIAESLHMAARIQSLASPGTALINKEAQELGNKAFTSEKVFSAVEIRGIAGTHDIYRLGQRQAAAHGAVEPQTLAPLFGRDAELQELRAHWTEAVGASARWVHLTGEAGIGKTRLISSFCSEIRNSERASTFVCRCYAETTGRAFGPIADMLERWFRLQTIDSPANRHARIMDTPSAQAIPGRDREAVQALLGHLAPLQGEHPGATNQSKPPKRSALLKTMAAWLVAQAHKAPLCLVIEDIQWADPSTLDFLSQLRTDGLDAPLLVVLTQRTGHAPPDPHPLTDATLHVDRLSELAVRQLIGHLSQTVDLPPGLIHTIARQSDGVPLFAEMSAKMAADDPVAFLPKESTKGLGEYPVPFTIRELLMHQLDRLSDARPLAQFCSVLGREFTQAELDTLADAIPALADPVARTNRMRALTEAGIVIERKRADGAAETYHFRHALIHEATYQSMWETDRRALHLAIAGLIVQKLPDLAADRPELLAWHFDAANKVVEGARWCRLAAKKYKNAEAHAESMAYLSRGRQLLQRLPEAERDHKAEVELELTAAGQIIATRGYGWPEAGACYVAALDVARKLGDTKSMLRAQLGLEAFHLMRADFGQAHAYLAEAQTTAEKFSDPLTRASLLFASANVLHHQGHGEAMLRQADQCIAVCQQGGLPAKLVQSPEVMAWMYSAVSSWELGLVESALMRAQRGVDRSRELGQRLGIGQALGMQAMILWWCGDNDRAIEASREAAGYCETGEHDMWLAHAGLMHGAAMAAQGKLEPGLRLMDEHYSRWTATGTIVTRTFYLAIQAEAHLRAGNRSLARQLADEAHSLVRKHGERYYEPEVLRIRAEIIKAQARLDRTGEEELAVETLNAARSSAAALGYLSFSLRVAMSTANWLVDEGKADTAVRQLTQALSALPEGHGHTADSVQARAILRRLGSQVS